MAKKSKTQKAKASAARAQKKAQAQQDVPEIKKTTSEEVEEPKGVEKKKQKTEAPAEKKQATKAVEKKPEKKQRFKFLREVRAELKRVTWPSRQDVLRWSGVVVAALLFFGIYVAVLDNLIVGPLLVAISGLGA